MSAITDLKKFMLAGNAVFTVTSEKTNTRFTFKVRAPENPTSDIKFVSVLKGPNNETDYGYLGFIKEGQYWHGGKSKISGDAPSAKAARWVCQRAVDGKPLTGVTVHHEGKCGRCGRRLTVPSSIESGFGPECINLV